MRYQNTYNETDKPIGLFSTTNESVDYVFYTVEEAKEVLEELIWFGYPEDEYEIVSVPCRGGVDLCN